MRHSLDLPFPFCKKPLSFYKQPLFCCCAAVLLLFSTNIAHAFDAESSLNLVASNYPLAYFAERLFGKHARVNLPAPPGEDPAFWKPSAQAVSLMQKADLVILNGADYEKWLPKVTLSRLKLVDSAAGFKDRFIVIENAVTHSHGPGGEHSHAGTAFTTWLDFTQAAEQADAIARVASRKYPNLKTEIATNLQNLQADLQQLDDEFRRVTASNPTRSLFASHPVYQYMARRYGLIAMLN